MRDSKTPYRISKNKSPNSPNYLWQGKNQLNVVIINKIKSPYEAGDAKLRLKLQPESSKLKTLKLDQCCYKYTSEFVIVNNFGTVADFLANCKTCFGSTGWDFWVCHLRRNSTSELALFDIKNELFVGVHAQP